MSDRDKGQDCKLQKAHGNRNLQIFVEGVLVGVAAGYHNTNRILCTHNKGRPFQYFV